MDNLCAITSDVRECINLFKASCTKRSDSVSKEEVASSRINISGFFRIALAILNLCFCPPESLFPLSPILVLYPFSVAVINSCAFAILAASITSCSLALTFPKRILLKIVSLNKIES